MFKTILVTSMVMPLLTQTPAAPIDPAWKLAVSTPTYHADINKTGASARYKDLVGGKPLVMYPYSGRNLCLSASSVPEEPDDAGYGWRVQIVPLRSDDGGLVAQVEWQRMWYRGERLPTGPKGSMQVTFRPGEPIVFDYLSSGERLVSSNMAAESRGVGRCTAIGMGLEIGLETPVRSEVVEADLWLVRSLPNGNEQSQHQTIRLSPRAGADFYFDDVTLPMQFFNGPATSVTLRTSGRLTLVDVAGGTSQVDVRIGQDVLGDLTRTGGSSTFRLKAGSGEVLAVQVPRVAPNAERMSLRLQLRQIR
jgi:hypothetical protein